MPWKKMEIREQRVEFVVRGLRGTEPLSQLCHEFGISAANRLPVAGALSRGRRSGHRRAQPSTAPLTHADRAGVRSAASAPCARLTLTGAHASWPCCWIAKGSGCRPAPSIACCCASVWCARLTGTRPPSSVSSASSRTSFGRWTSRGRRTGRRLATALSVIDDHSRYLVALAGHGAA